jgi:soluble lytic murein transglycosylase-like protein
MVNRDDFLDWAAIVFTALLFLTLFTRSVANSSEIERTIRTIAKEEGINPDLAIAIAKVESGLNPKKIGKVGEIGLFQLRPEFHKIGTQKQNIRTAMRYLKYLKGYCGPTYKEAYFICYNVGPSYKRILFPKRFKYYIAVMSEMNRVAKDNHK